jgi:hypothetical protein
MQGAKEVGCLSPTEDGEWWGLGSDGCVDKLAQEAVMVQGASKRGGGQADKHVKLSMTVDQIWCACCYCITPPCSRVAASCSRVAVQISLGSRAACSAVCSICCVLQITQQVDEQAEGPPLTLTAVSGQSISLTTDMLKVRSGRRFLRVNHCHICSSRIPRITPAIYKCHPFINNNQKKLCVRSFSPQQVQSDLRSGVAETLDQSGCTLQGRCLHP